ncbi:ABC transporter permease [Mesorhizobium sp. ESP6-5]|uniref:ABC-type dipeptide/oligopeptide/nickel transport system, permease component n=1 Tax=Mesorhizobium australicum (strain HAMBI 3006 / LMG 24608 / WSM2073) TaxID=754035 RepID=L0KNP2_MESAW|nr:MULTISPECIES: ABC transporter permease [Mesorhizobium]MBZ9928970.1 ABC transporter permease [Mesorhizobium sp. BR1-1-5]AGB45713.1 ABC-type dipeptide/oligopeptide/nickel transport system, permease component [Mesorhizobium australicum WSM2073]MBZ9682275.1 ABC transporter permease [Mesorhizobium sp. CO1-1-2]MBZ9699131.1 ABC transporter permease [Mesorhizobium sp. CO1-1-9]MBZ9723381.1 ABC transporter permease [Mesorhizobium sp. CO1-1-11]
MQAQYIGASTIILEVLWRFWPVWAALAIVMGASFLYKKKLALYGQLFDSGVGIAGVFICLFWLFTAIFASTISPFDPLGQIPIMKDTLPGAIEPQSGLVYLFGGDKLARDVFSRMVYGSQIVLIIAPAATGFALMVGITLGLPAGYYGGKIDSILSFLANLVLAFPVILLFYLLVTPGIMDTPIPYALAGVFFLFPIIFFSVLFWTRYKNRPDRIYILLGLTLIIGGWIYLGLVFDRDPLHIVHIDPNQLNIFVAVVFASSPGVFRIVRGLVMDIKTRDYVAAAQTRGESPWYIMLWEILPNARGPLIVDACLRIGYTTILLGTLGYFGLGLAPESPDWGTAIKDASRLLRSFIHPALPPTIALMSFVLGLNLLADSLREQSMKD